MAKLEELLKKNGYTEADLAALAPLLSDAKFRGAVEGEFGTAESRATKAEKEASEWSTWHQETAIPTLEKYMTAEEKVRMDNGQLREQLKIAQERGLTKVAISQGEQVPDTNTSKPGESKFDTSKFVTKDDVQKFGDMYGDAIAVAQDVVGEYYDLFGKPLSYVNEQTGQKGFQALRKEAMAAKKDVASYVAEKFDFAGRRKQISAEATAANEKRIRDDERAKTIAETVNPMLRAPQSSNSPWGNRPKEMTEGKNPWDVTPEQRSGERVAKATKNLLMNGQR